MSSQTTNLGLYKPDLSDTVNTTIPQLSSNFDKIDSSLADIANDDTFKNNHFLSTLSSYIGVQNTGYTSDNGTRFYVIPKDHVTTGCGGAIKIFGDNYAANQDYRDLGIYFYADQQGDKGSNGNGVYWINQKVLDNGMYAGKHPDIGFSFQDGQKVAGRFCRIVDGNGDRTVFIVGAGQPNASKNAPSPQNIVLELQGDECLRNADYVRWLNATTSGTSGISNGSDDYMKASTWNGFRIYAQGNLLQESSIQTSNIKNALVTSSRVNVTTNVTTFDVTGANRVVINQPNANNISSITGGVDGQEIVLLCMNPNNTTILSGATIKLQGGTNYTMGNYHTLTLINVSGNWYEKCRSANG